MVRKNQQFLPLAIALGIGLGTLVGYIRNELVFYIGISAVLGVLLGVLVDQKNMVNREVAKGEKDRNTDDLLPKF